MYDMQANHVSAGRRMDQIAKGLKRASQHDSHDILRREIRKTPKACASRADRKTGEPSHPSKPILYLRMPLSDSQDIDAALSPDFKTPSKAPQYDSRLQMPGNAPLLEQDYFESTRHLFSKTNSRRRQVSPAQNYFPNAVYRRWLRLRNDNSDRNSTTGKLAGIRAAIDI